MKEWFSVKTDRFSQVDWNSTPNASFGGPLISGARTACISGGFGYMLFQGLPRPRYGL